MNYWQSSRNHPRNIIASRRTSKLDDADIGNLTLGVGWLLRRLLYPCHQSVGHVRDDLHRLTEELATPLTLDDARIKLPRD